MKVTSKTRMRWHPLFVCLCLNLSRVSPKAYEVMKESGLSLPTRRTLNDYTHWLTAKPGFSHEVDSFLLSEMKVDELEDWKRYCMYCACSYMIISNFAILRYVTLVIDEMKIQEDLVYDKTGSNFLGFVNLGEVNNDLEALEGQLKNSIKSPDQCFATHMLTVMIRGIFVKLEFPYANFPSQGNTMQLGYCILN